MIIEISRTKQIITINPHFINQFHVHMYCIYIRKHAHKALHNSSIKDKSNNTAVVQYIEE